MSANLFELNQLRCFVAVAEELNFRRAARRLNMTQPPLSRHINLLEHAVGVRLFDRSTRSVRLTLAGERFLFDAVDILHRAESAMLFARQAERGETGSVVLGFVPTATIELVPLVVKRLRRKLPAVSVTPREMMSHEQIEALRAGSLDIGITRLPRNPESLTISRVWSEPFLVALPKDHPLTARDKLRVEDLHGQPMIGYSTERGGFLFEVVSGYLTSSGVSPNLLYSVSQAHTVMSLVDSGLGLGLVPRSYALVAMKNTAMRDFEQPENFRSDLYMVQGPRSANSLVSRVAQEITVALAEASPTLPAP
ncbi:LysR substrate-binding domain-containing protein [Frigidibacter sp. ROC022]|uniref:LysR substrate-binding domain-containing protein n=1 Tax=Frigidibacter sp. ROC022 TaxID=2971796 RepID=UPI00215AA938|nr:LysR substrate-binding domain-containing protein [Frigidibacter sp. ROC022]MCR8725644.1 LysR substrate-binding domain-containing protein [Frigidibacter sp. ROC022]